MLQDLGNAASMSALALCHKVVITITKQGLIFATVIEEASFHEGCSV
jgi:hypothetical protein